MIFKNCLLLQHLDLWGNKNLTQKCFPEINDIYDLFGENDIDTLMATKQDKKIYSHLDIVKLNLQ